MSNHTIWQRFLTWCSANFTNKNVAHDSVEQSHAALDRLENPDTQPERLEFVDSATFTASNEIALAPAFEARKLRVFIDYFPADMPADLCAGLKEFFESHIDQFNGLYGGYLRNRIDVEKRGNFDFPNRTNFGATTGANFELSVDYRECGDATIGDLLASWIRFANLPTSKGLKLIVAETDETGEHLLDSWQLLGIGPRTTGIYILNPRTKVLNEKDGGGSLFHSLDNSRQLPLSFKEMKGGPVIMRRARELMAIFDAKTPVVSIPNYVVTDETVGLNTIERPVP